MSDSCSNINLNTDNECQFDHKFEGWSIWLEPCPIEAAEIVQEMKKLSSQCGGPKEGTHLFPLHCTLLYNFKPPSTRLSNGFKDNKKNRYLCHDGLKEEEEDSIKMLQKCIEKFYQACDDHTSSQEEEVVERMSSSSPLSSTLPRTHCIELNPSDFYFFPYPKEADNGRGFGCVISMLLLENNKNLQMIHDIVAEMFPPDERHGGSGKHENNNEEQTGNEGATHDKLDYIDEGMVKDKKNPDKESSKSIHNHSHNTSKEEARQKKKSKFIPHMALVYAPEVYHIPLQQSTARMKTSKAHFLKNPMRAKFLSLWSTEGTLKDWKAIAKIELY